MYRTTFIPERSIHLPSQKPPTQFNEYGNFSSERPRVTIPKQQTSKNQIYTETLRSMTNNASIDRWYQLYDQLAQAFQTVKALKEAGLKSNAPTLIDFLLIDNDVKEYVDKCFKPVPKPELHSLLEQIKNHVGHGEKKKRWCRHCFSIGLSTDFYSSHTLTSDDGELTCPTLKSSNRLTCSNGNKDFVHTAALCPRRIKSSLIRGSINDNN